MKKGKKWLGGYLVILLIALAGIFLWWKINVRPQCFISNWSRCPEKIFVISKGEKLSSIAVRLEKEALIKNSLIFRILVWKMGISKNIQAGDFKLSSVMTPREISQQLTHGTLDIWITIPEGWRSEEIAQKISSDFLSEAQESEGYLFPDTYLIPKEASASMIIKIMKDNFHKKVDDNLRNEMKQKNLGLKETIILASIVEREAKFDEDRPVVAGILINRWKAAMPLQADATVQYAIGSNQQPATSNQPIDWWPEIKPADLKIDSPYNTYKNPGLPPSPICNPGLAAIKAVVYSADTDYLYYLSDKEGKMHYAKTLEEHNKNIEKYILMHLDKSNVI